MTSQEAIKKLLDLKLNEVVKINGTSIKFDNEVALQSFKLGVAVANKINQCGE